MLGKKWVLFTLFVVVGSIPLAACKSKIKKVEVTRVVKQVETVVEKETILKQETIVETVTVVEQVTVVKKETVVVEATKAPAEAGPRTLVICLGMEPPTLYDYSGQAYVNLHIYQAIYDGPIDNRTYDYQPIILERLPSLADGDAAVERVTVEAGDQVVDDAGAPVTLEEGVRVRPAGCYASACAVEFTGAPVEMERMAATFKLMEGILWSDGEPLTSYDSVYSFELASDPDTPAGKFTIDRTASYEAIDDLTTVWTGLPGYRDSTYFLNFWSPKPEHVWGEYSTLELLEAEESARLPLGWGPYVIEEWVLGDHATLSRNELYWRADEGLPRFDRLIFRFVGMNTNANVAALLAGECDVVDFVGLQLQHELLLELHASGQLVVQFASATFWEHADFGINPVESYERPDFFEDVRTRQAIAMCLDRQAVVDALLYGQVSVPDTYVPPDHPLFNPDARHYGFDVAAGAALLEEVGWIDDDGDPATPRVARGVEGVPDGTPLEFTYATTSNPERQRAVEMFQASLAECGVKVNPEYWSGGEFFADGPEGPLFGRRFDVGQFGWVLGAEPPCDYFISQAIPGPAEEGFRGWGGSNLTGWSDEAYDAACNAALWSLPGTPEYEQYHKEAQRIFAENLPVVPLYQRLKPTAHRPDLKNLFVDPTQLSEMWNIEEFDIE